MATEVLVPTLGESITEATLGEWLKKPGDAVRAEGVAIAVELSQRLLDEGVPCLHYYTLNFARATREVLAGLGLAPARPAPLATAGA